MNGPFVMLSLLIFGLNVLSSSNIIILIMIFYTHSLIEQNWVFKKNVWVIKCRQVHNNLQFKLNEKKPTIFVLNLVTHNLEAHKSSTLMAQVGLLIKA